MPDAYITAPRSKRRISVFIVFQKRISDILSLYPIVEKARVYRHTIPKVGPVQLCYLEVSINTTTGIPVKPITHRCSIVMHLFVLEVEIDVIKFVTLIVAYDNLSIIAIWVRMAT